jgi:hypothetical protein
MFRHTHVTCAAPDKVSLPNDFDRYDKCYSETNYSVCILITVIQSYDGLHMSKDTSLALASNRGHWSTTSFDVKHIAMDWESLARTWGLPEMWEVAHNDTHKIIADSSFKHRHAEFWVLLFRLRVRILWSNFLLLETYWKKLFCFVLFFFEKSL